MPQGREEVLNKRSSRAQESSLTGRPKGELQNLGKAGKAAAWRKREKATLLSPLRAHGLWAQPDGRLG